MDGFASARERYRPNKVKCILVAESPPKLGSGRFFYFEDVRSRDGLFLETMRVLYGSQYDFSDVPSIRRRKRELLCRFRDDGFYLIDSTDEAIAGLGSSVKRRKIRSALPRLREELQELAGHRIPIILISATVYRECNEMLRAEGFNILNTEQIELPVQGHQPKFRCKLDEALRSRCKAVCGSRCNCTEDRRWRSCGPTGRA